MPDCSVNSLIMLKKTASRISGGCHGHYLKSIPTWHSQHSRPVKQHHWIPFFVPDMLSIRSLTWSISETQHEHISSECSQWDSFWTVFFPGWFKSEIWTCAALRDQQRRINLIFSTIPAMPLDLFVLTFFTFLSAILLGYCLKQALDPTCHSPGPSHVCL